jgi:hypothetical protein
MLKNLEKMATEIEELIKELDRGLPSKVRSFHHSTMATGIHMLHGAIMHSIVELATESFLLYKNKKLIPSVVIVRALFERSAMLFYMYNLVESSLKDGLVEDKANELEKLMWGSSAGLSPIENINVMKFIRTTGEKIKIDAYLSLYDALSELSHPNFGGIISAYINYEDLYNATFGRYDFDSKISCTLVTALHTSLSLVKIFDVELGEKLPIYAEKHIKENPNHLSTFTARDFLKQK